VTDPAFVSQAPAMQETFRVFFEEHFDYVYRSLRRLGVHERDLEDVAHDVFLEVHGAIDRLDASRPPKPWLFAFAFRFASDYRRLGRHRLVPSADMDAVAHVGTSRAHGGAEGALIDAQNRALVGRAMEELDLDRRAIIVLHDVDEVPVPEIATALGIPLNTAYSRLRLGREELRAAVKRQRARER
jgi:RNA polymerase sigma-70 factor, ECF subfamily